MVSGKCKAYLEAHRGEMLALLEELVMIDSGSYFKAGVDRVAAVLEKAYRDAGFETRVMEHEDCGNGLVVTRPGGGVRVLLIGHLDTVFLEGAAAANPFRISDGIAYGPGVLDQKSCLVGALYAIKALLAVCSGELPTVTVVMSGDEEIGSFHMRELFESQARGSDWGIVIEPAREHGEIVIERKGGGGLTVRATGRAAHAGIEPRHGRNAIEELALKIPKLKALNDFEAGITVTIGQISGGEARNVVARYAEMAVDLRFSTPQHGEALFEAIRKILAEPEIEGVTLDYDLTLYRQPLTQVPGVEKLHRTVKEAGDELGIEYKTAKTGGLSDGNFTAAVGLPTVDGLGPVGGLMCSPDEYLEVDSMVPRAARLAAVLHKLQNAK
ncbi:MAG TPA: M20 family metallopeptidase [Terriglobales bacterium]|nr:M20 family metallopeptidase [Terriglobales bacterium]